MLLLTVTFGFVLIATFGIVITLTRPTEVERNIAARLESIRMGNERVRFGEYSPELLKPTALSRMEWLNAVLQRWPLAYKIQLLLSQAESRWSVGQILLMSGGAALLAFLAISYFLPLLYVDAVVAVVAGAMPFAIIHLQRGRRLTRFDRGLADAIDLISRSLRAGHSLSAAVEIVSEQAAEPVRSEFRKVYTQQNFGLPFREAMLQLIQRVPSADLQYVVTGILLQKETGGNLVEILERTNEVIRERLRLQGQLKIYTAQGRLSGWILSLLPVLMFLFINLANPGYSHILADDPWGRKLVGVGVAQMVLGILVIRKITKVKV